MEWSMDRSQIEPAIKSILDEVHQRMIEATRIAKAADACAQAGSIDEAVTVSMELERIFYEAGRLQDAVSLLKRLAGS
jgi:hypothetical protein